MRTFIPLVLLATLSACQTTRYVTVPCLTAEQYEELRRAEPDKVGPKLTGDPREDSKILAGSAIRLRGYSHGLLTVLDGCKG